jgi:hypothetical protein
MTSGTVTAWYRREIEELKREVARLKRREREIIERTWRAAVDDEDGLIDTVLVEQIIRDVERHS